MHSFGAFWLLIQAIAGLTGANEEPAAPVLLPMPGAGVTAELQAGGADLSAEAATREPAPEHSFRIPRAGRESEGLAQLDPVPSLPGTGLPFERLAAAASPPWQEGSRAQGEPSPEFAIDETHPGAPSDGGRLSYLRYDTYAEFRTGPLFGAGSRNEIDRYSFLEVEIGRRITEHGAAFFQFDYLQGDARKHGIDTENVALQALIGGAGRVAAGPCDLYAGAGVGVGYARFEQSDPGFRAKDDAFLLVWNVRAGVTINLTSRLFVGVEGRWNGSTSGEADDVKFNLNGYGAFASLGLRF